MADIRGPDGKIVVVDDCGRLTAFAVSEPEDKQLNKDGGMHSAYFSVAVAGTDDYFFYFKNNGITDIFFTDFRVSASAPTTLYYEEVSGTPVYSSESPIITVNRNLGSPKTLTADVSSDENITGLTSEGVLFFEKISTANARNNLKTTSNIIVPQGKAIAFRSSAAVTVEGLISIVDGLL